MAKITRLDACRSSKNDRTSRIGSIATLRLISHMEVDEFAAAVGKELGWPVPLFVYLQWERANRTSPPPQVLDAARQVALRNPIDKATSSMSRRRFLGGVVGLSTLAASGFPISAQALTSTLNIGGRGRKWRASPETASDLESLVESYRSAYAGKATIAELLPGATGLMRLLIDLGKHDQWPGGHPRLASAVGQIALLAGLLHLMGRRNLDAAQAHYNLALQGAREAQDWDLATYALGSLAFQAQSARRSIDARAINDAAWDLASRRAKPRTRAWAAARTSELHARDGDEAASRQFLEHARVAIEDTQDEPTWKGVGWFDEARLAGYEGGNLALLGHHSAAERLLRGSLNQLHPLRVKHRCTLSADLATALLHRHELEESCAYAMKALSLATSIEHRESVDRVRGVHFRLARWKRHPSVCQLTEQLRALCETG